MYFDFSVTRRDKCLADRTKGFKRIKVVYLLLFQELSILPVHVFIISIKHHCLLDLRCISSLLSLGSLEEVVHLLKAFHIPA